MSQKNRTGEVNPEQPQYREWLKRSIVHLRYSFQKIENLPVEFEKMDEESLETWESFAARFSRVVDLFLTKYLRAVVLENDPGFQGSLRDFVDQGEKLGLIDSADQWMAWRGLRNTNAHEYFDERFTRFNSELKSATPHVLKIDAII